MNQILARASLLGVGLFLLSYNVLADDYKPKITHGVASGDVTTDSVVIWSRADIASTMNVKISGETKGKKHKSQRVSAVDDFTGKIQYSGLKPNTRYEYEVWFGMHSKKQQSDHLKGSFKTAPRQHHKSAVDFAWGGDLAGQNVCRDSESGFPIFNAINSSKLDFFIGLGDMIYADGLCESKGRYGNTQIAGDFIQSADMKDFWAHWKYNREDKGYRQLLAKTSYVAIWDDHEVVNDFGPLADTRETSPYTPGEKLLPKGLSAFLDYNPVSEKKLTPKRLYRSIRWGQHLEVIVLDNRQYRDANLEDDNDTLVKTMLGREQVAWLKDTINRSDATWKIIVSSVPISIPTGFPANKGRDGWANFDQTTGFERELVDIFDHMYKKGERNIVFITTDVHFAEVFRYTPFADRPEFKVHEYVTGPLNAGLFPNRNFDDSLGTESLFFYGPESSDAVTTYQQALPWMNYGAASIDKEGVLTLSVRDVNGNIRYQAEHVPNR